MAYSPPAGNAVILNFVGSYAAPAGNAVVLNFYDGFTIGEMSPDDVETLVSGTYYYRRIQAPYAVNLDTVHYMVAQTSAPTKVTGFVYADSAGAVGAQLATSARANGTTANVDTSLALTSTVTLAAGDWFWAAVLIEDANVNGKIKGGGAGKKGTGGTPATTTAAYAIWASGQAITSAVPVLAIGDSLSHVEGASGATAYDFDVTRQLATSGATSVDWAVTGTGSNPASASDFVGSTFPSGTLNFSADDTLKQITVNVVGDTSPEQDETFTVTLSNASGGAAIGKTTSIGTITNDDYTSAPASAAQAQSATSPTLAAKATVSPASASHGHSATSPTLDFDPGAVLPNSAAHSQAATEPDIDAKSTAAPASASEAHAASSPTLAAASDVDPNSAAQGHASSQPSVIPRYATDPDDAEHDHEAASPTISAKSIVSPASASHLQASTSPMLLAKSTTSPDDAVHAQALSSPLVVYTVLINSAAHAQASSEPSLAAKSFVYPGDARHDHIATTAEVALRILPADASPDRLGVFVASSRLGIVAGINRTALAASYSRLGIVPGLDRSAAPAANERDGDVPGVDRSTSSPSSDRGGSAP